MLSNIIFARAFLQTVTITGNSKILNTCSTIKMHCLSSQLSQFSLNATEP